jgi:hypothetical protein
MRRLVTLLLLSAGAIACLVTPAVDAKSKKPPKRPFNVQICIGLDDCAPLKAPTDRQGNVVSLKATLKDPGKAAGDPFPESMKDVGWITAQAIDMVCPPTCTAQLPVAGKDVSLAAKEAPPHGYGSGYDFHHWEGVKCNEGETSKTCTFHASGNPKVKAIFYSH